jgi:conjugative transfer region protein TrbK
MKTAFATFTIAASLLLASACESGDAPIAPADLKGEELRALLQRCRVDMQTTGEATCRAAYEESRKRFHAPSKPNGNRQ